MSTSAPHLGWRRWFPASTLQRTSAPRHWPSPSSTSSSRPSPDNLIALRQEAAVYRNIKEPRQIEGAHPANHRHRPLQTLKPSTPSASSTGCRPTQTPPSKFLPPKALKDDGQGNVKQSPATCEAMRTANTELVDDAIANLTRAVDLKPDYADAMVYLNHSLPSPRRHTLRRRLLGRQRSPPRPRMDRASHQSTSTTNPSPPTHLTPPSRVPQVSILRPGFKISSQYPKHHPKHPALIPPLSPFLFSYRVPKCVSCAPHPCSSFRERPPLRPDRSRHLRRIRPRPPSAAPEASGTATE